MPTTITERLAAIREVLRREKLAAFIFPSTDPHNGEYVPEHWKGREYVSGFCGSAGTAVVTLRSAALWTDSRYFIAAEAALRGTEYQLMKEKVAGTPTIAAWTAREALLTEFTEVGIDGMVCSEATVRALKTELRAEGGVTLRTNLDPLAETWAGRPEEPLTPVEVLPVELCGLTAHEKICQIRRAALRCHAAGVFVAQLDDIAWTLNIRAQDVHCTPLCLSYLLIGETTATLFVDSRKLSPEVAAYLRAEGVETREYKEVAAGLRSYTGYNLLMDPQEVNHTLYNIAREKAVEATSPIAAMKAVKSEAEICGYRRAMVRDGVALVRFLRWLKEGARRQVGEGGAGQELVIDGTVQTELTVDEKLTALRSRQPLYRGLSFDTIAGYAEHGAIVHYEATAQSAATLRACGLLLLDSGAQYQDGTTDITRTIPLGPLTDEERRVYTLVLKGNINLARTIFPDGASGTQLDIMARSAMWREGYNYLHGTGHGVGSYLSVHEGPHQIRMEWKPTPLRAGMTVTDEPGIYLEGRFGVRIENTMLITAASPGGREGFLRLTPLTLCPIDQEPIVWEMLTAEERKWLADYHATVYSVLAPQLSDDERVWLAAECGVEKGS